MMETALIGAMLKIGCVGFIDSQDVARWKTFKSGVLSQVYLDLRLLSGDPAARLVALSWLVGAVKSTMKSNSLDQVTIVGMATGSISLAALVAHETGNPFRYVRSEAKDHGTKQSIEGGDVKGHYVIFIEDVVTMGESSIPAILSLRAAGARVLGCLCLFTYGFPFAIRRFDHLEIPFFAAVTLPDLLSVMLAEKRIREKDSIYLLGEWLKNPPMAKGRKRFW